MINKNIQFNIFIYSYYNFIHIINEILFNFYVTKIFGHSLYFLNNTSKISILRGKPMFINMRATNLKFHLSLVLRVPLVKMGCKIKTTSFDIKQLVIFHHEKGKSYCEINALLNLSNSTVMDIIKSF